MPTRSEEKVVRDIEKVLFILSKLREIAGRTRFQKIIFLLKHKEGINFSYIFVPYYYGPYSFELQLDINLLEAAGLLEIIPKDGTLYLHRLTSEGEKLAAKVEEKIDPQEREKIEKALKKYERKSTSTLIEEAKKIVISSA